MIKLLANNISRWLQIYIKFWTPPQPRQVHEEDTEIAQFFVTIISATVVTLIGYTGYFFYLGINILALIVGLASLSLLLLLSLIKLYFPLRKVVALGIVNNQILLFLLTIYTGGLDSPMIWWLAFNPIACIFAHSVRAGIIVGVSNALFLGLFFFPNFPLNSIENLLDPTLIQTFRFLNLFCIAGMLGIFVTRYIKIKKEIVKLKTQALHKASNELDVTKDQLQQMLEEKRSLIKIISHDLANGIHGITLRAEAGLIKTEDPNQKKLLKGILKTVGRQSQILEKVRELQKSNQGIDQFEIKSVNLLTALNDTRILFEDQLKNKNIELTYDSSSLKRLEVLAEENSLVMSVLSNVVSNAIKFSYPDSKIRIDSQVENGHIILRVKDHGAGISKDDLQEFDLHKEIHTKEGTTGEGGSGFGLSLCNEFMEHYGGSLQLESQTEEESKSNHGTTVKLAFKKPN